MEIKFNAGDSVHIPDGCKAVVKDGSVVFEREQEFKDGDVLVSVYNGCMVIFEKYNSAWSFKSHYNEGYDKDASFNNDAFRHATEEEKRLLFDKMKKQGLRWNAKEKRVEKIRWRAKKGDDYYFIDSFCYLGQDSEDFQLMDDKVYNSYNYFRTEEQAKEAAERMKETLRKFHEEIGE